MKELLADKLIISSVSVGTGTALLAGLDINDVALYMGMAGTALSIVLIFVRFFHIYLDRKLKLKGDLRQEERRKEGRERHEQEMLSMKVNRAARNIENGKAVNEDGPLGRE